MKLIIHSQTSAGQPWKLWDYSTISSHTLLGVWVLAHTGIEAYPCPMTGEFPAQGPEYVGNVSIWWRHHYKHCSGLLWNEMVCKLDSVKNNFSFVCTYAFIVFIDILQPTYFSFFIFTSWIVFKLIYVCVSNTDPWPWFNVKSIGYFVWNFMKGLFNHVEHSRMMDSFDWLWSFPLWQRMINHGRGATFHGILLFISTYVKGVTDCFKPEEHDLRFQSSPCLLMA